MHDPHVNSFCLILYFARSGPDLYYLVPVPPLHVSVLRGIMSHTTGFRIHRYSIPVAYSFVLLGERNGTRWYSHPTAIPARRSAARRRQLMRTPHDLTRMSLTTWRPYSPQGQSSRTVLCDFWIKSPFQISREGSSWSGWHWMLAD